MRAQTVVNLTVGKRQQMRKQPCKPTTTVNNIIKGVNKSLALADGIDMTIERLVPLWTPTWDHFDPEGKMVKRLKHSKISRAILMTHGMMTLLDWWD